MSFPVRVIGWLSGNTAATPRVANRFPTRAVGLRLARVPAPASGLNVLFVTVDQWRGDCLGSAGHPVVRTPEPRPPRGRRRVVPPALRAGRAVRAEPGVALHRHVPDEPPVGAQRHAARRPPHQRRAGRPRAGLRARALRLHRHEHRPPHRRARRPPPPHVRGRAARLRPGRATSPRATRRSGSTGCAPRASTSPTTGGAFVDRPAAGTTWRTQYDAKHSQTVFLTDRLLDFVDDRSGGRASRGSRTSRTSGRTRRSSRPRRTTRCTTPRRSPTPVARRDPRRGRRAAPAARGDDQPSGRRVARRPAGATRAAGHLLRDDGRGRRPARPRASTCSTRRASRRRHARRAHVGSRRDARRPLDPAQARLVRPDVPRAADRARPAQPVRRDARPGRRRVHRARRRAPDDRGAPRRRGAAAVRRPSAHAVARRRLARRLAHRGALRVRLPRPRRRRCSKARSASRSRSARSRCCATTTASTCTSPATPRCRRSSSTSTSIPTQSREPRRRSRVRAPRCSTTRSACSPGACATPSARSPA